jgi:hypothetical protein
VRYTVLLLGSESIYQTYIPEYRRYTVLRLGSESMLAGVGGVAAVGASIYQLFQQEYIAALAALSLSLAAPSIQAPRI